MMIHPKDRAGRICVASSFVLAAAVLLAAGADDGSRVPFPEGYRGWTHVKKAKGQATVHHIYANPIALKGYAAGVFPDGSVLAFEEIELKTNEDKTTNEGALKRVDVMVKDKERFKETDGWGYNSFANGDPTVPGLSAAAVKGCASCHDGQKDHDRVFSVMPS